MLIAIIVSSIFIVILYNPKTASSLDTSFFKIARVVVIIVMIVLFILIITK